MIKNVLTLVLFAALLNACNSDKCSGDCCKKDAKAGEPVPTSSSATVFGAAFQKDGAMAFDEMLTRMGTADSMDFKIKGKVQEVCQVKGCWMTITSSDPSKPPMRVEFKDYAFFMPKDIAGKEVVINGYAFTEVTTVDELKHFAEDAKKSKEEISKITEPKKELKFMASGVEIL